MKNKIMILVMGTAIVAVIALGIWYEIYMWKQCRLTNSWFYCMRILSK